MIALGRQRRGRKSGSQIGILPNAVRNTSAQNAAASANAGRGGGAAGAAAPANPAVAGRAGALRPQSPQLAVAERPPAIGVRV